MQEFNIYIYIEREGEREMFSFCVLLMTKACSKWLRYRTFIKMNLMLAFSINFISKNFTVSNIVMNEFRYHKAFIWVTLLYHIYILLLPLVIHVKYLYI